MPTRYDALVKVLTEIGNPSSNSKFLGDDFRFQSFSDSIVMSSNASTQGLTHLLLSITALAIHLLENGLLIHGAVVKGSRGQTRDRAPTDAGTRLPGSPDPTRH